MYRIGNNEENTKTADPDITCCGCQCFWRCLHQNRDRTRKAYQYHEQDEGKYGKDDGTAAEYSSDLFLLFFTKVTRDQYGDTHGKLYDHKGHKIQYLTACGNTGKSCCRTEASDNQKVNSAVGCLQDKGT